MTKICVLSDLHGHLPRIESCELVLLAGDIVPLNIQFDNAESTLWFLDEFTKWIDSLPCDEVIMIAGNHDKLIERASFIIHAVESKLILNLHICQELLMNIQLGVLNIIKYTALLSAISLVIGHLCKVKNG